MKKFLVFALLYQLFLFSVVANASPLDTIDDKLRKTAQDRYGIDTDLHISVTDFVESSGTYYVSSGGFSGVQTASIVPTRGNPRFTSVLLPCDGTKLRVCVEAVSYRKISESVWKNATLQVSNALVRTGQVAITYADGSTQAYGSVEEDLESNRPAGGNASVWRMEAAPHKGGQDYFLSAIISNFPRGYTQNPLDLSVELEPIKITTPGDVRQYQFPNNVRQYQFPDNVEYRVVLRLEALLPKLSKWYSARLGSPNISITQEKLEVTGRPVKVPLARSLSIPCDRISLEQKQALANSFQLQGFQKSCTSSGVLIVAEADVMDNGKAGFEVFRNFENVLYEIGKNSLWSFKANYELGECNSNDVTGFASSNAMMFTPNPPIFDKSSQTLIYQMASTHVDRTGAVNVGNFDIVLRKSVAECLWKMKSPDLYQVAVSLIYSNGESVVGTVSVNSSGDWIKINVSNFSFSSPTLKLRFVPIEKSVTPESPKEANQAATPQPVVTSKPTPVEEAKIANGKPIKKTIFCVKGKTIKKIIAVKPKCPSGYVKR